MILLLWTRLARADLALPEPPPRGAQFPAPALDAPPPPGWVWLVALGGALILGALLWGRWRRSRSEA